MVRRSSANQAVAFLGALLFFSNVSATLFSRQTNGTAWWGRVEMTKFVRRVRVHQYFLDIEEDIELAAHSSRKPPDNRHTLEIYGSFRLPAQSVITGVLIWYGDSLLRGKLKSKETAREQYEEKVDRETSPPPRPQDPVLIEKITRYDDYDIYNCAIYPVEWGKSRKIRVRYLCPQRYVNGKLMMQIPSSMTAEISKPPATISQTIEAYDDIESVMFHSGQDSDTLFLPATLSEAYNYNRLASAFVRVHSRENAMMVKTAFDNGAWKGNYAMYWGTPPESLLVKAGLRREVVFLWKWNFWHSFVFKDETGKSISPFGREVINQAQQIYQSNIAITGAGDKVALLIDKGEPDLNTMFPLCGEGSGLFDSLQSFLLCVDSTHLVSTISGTAPPITIRIADDEKERFLRRGAESFDIALKVVCSLFSEHENIMKHIVFVSAGPVPEMPNLEDFYRNSDTLLGDQITISAYGSCARYPMGYWPGVPMHRIVEKRALTDDGAFVQNFWLPAKKDAWCAVTVKNARNSYTKELKAVAWRRRQYRYDTIATDTAFFAGHSTIAWEDAVEWKAYDSSNKLLATHTQVPELHLTPNDTFCVKLWAGAHNPVSDTSFDAHRGARFGIVDQQYSLLALEQDAVNGEEKERQENEGLPFLSDDEIFLPASLDRSSHTRQAHFAGGAIKKCTITRYNNGSFLVIVPAHERIIRVRIYDLKGRLVRQIDKKPMQTQNRISFTNHGRLSRGLYTLVIETNVKRYLRSFHIL